MIRINTQTLTFALGCLLLGASSCSRENDFQSGDKLLKVNVQMASPMLTRGATTSPIISDTIDMGNDLVLVATSRPRDYEPQEALTRGTPIRSAATLPSMNIKVYNSGTGSFSNSTALKTTLKGTNSSGAWSLSPSYMIMDGVKNTYMAYSPIEDANNGIVVAANGRTLTYTTPAFVANQPDLCSATIVKDDVSSNLPLAMQHRLTAVGIKVSADNVTIDEISVLNVSSNGVLNLETGTWGQWSGNISCFPILTTTTPATGGAMADITATNGYLMLPPQTFTNSMATLFVMYTYAGGKRQAASCNLKDLTGGKWEAGQIVTYEIQLKAKFSLTTSPANLTLGAVAGTASFTYSTNSPSTNDPQFTNKDGHTWIKNIQVDRANKRVTFNYDASIAEGTRSAVVSGISGFTSKDIGLSQSLNLAISPTSGGTIAGAGGSVTVNVTASKGVAWSVTVSNCTASPSSGTGNGGAQAVTLTIPANSSTAQRAVSATFKVTSPVAITRTWSATQKSQVIEIKGLKWATGNLVANGANGAKVGVPGDYGLYFQFGSLVGWTGGANGDGTGTGSPALAINIRPTGYTGGTAWNNCGYSSGAIPASGVASTGIGDPCRFYLGSPWRLPTNAEFQTSLCNGYADGNSLGSANAAWQGSPAGINFNNNSTKLFIPASGYRSNNSGGVFTEGIGGYCWSESVNATNGYNLSFYSGGISQQDSNKRHGFSVRCVQ